MEINQSIFKSYDIRGIYPGELNEQTVYQIGKGFVKYTGANSSASLRARKVVVGYDARLSSPILFDILVGGIISEGANVYDIGLVPTECLYFAVAHYDFDSGIMKTASHNPKEYNGFKMVKKDGDQIEMVRGKDLFSVIKKGDFKEGARGLVYQKDILKEYIDYIFSLSMSTIKPLRVVVDASNGVIGKVISAIKEKVPLEIIDLNFNPDGNFPNHSPNPLLPGSVDQITKEIKKQKADFGFIFDGDADRVFLVDEKGQLVSADITLLFLAKYFLSKNSGAGIAYNAICSKAVPEFVKKWGGVPIRTQVGFVNVREGMIKNNGIMGGELSAHYCFRDYFYMDSGMVVFLTLLQIISSEGKSVSEIVRELSIYAPPFQKNFKIDDKDAMLQKVKAKYAEGKQDYLDGVTVEYKDWWFNLRPSNTEPLLKLTVEANTIELLEEKKKELVEFIITR